MGKPPAHHSQHRLCRNQELCGPTQCFQKTTKYSIKKLCALDRDERYPIIKSGQKIVYRLILIIMTKFKKALPYLASGLLPLMAFAQTADTVLVRVDRILQQVIPILLLICTIVFLWGVIPYLTAGPDEEKQKYGKYLIICGLVGLFAMVAIWGFVRVLTQTFGVGGQRIPRDIGGI